MTWRGAIILQGTGAHFDPRVVQAFLATELQFIALQESLAEPGTEPKAAARQSEGHSLDDKSLEARAVCGA